MIVISSCALMNNSREETKTGINAALKLWQRNCSHCHNVPNPASFSDAEWEVIGSHMQVRAYLSGKEVDDIIEFLKTIN